jgi:RNA polymerase sigma-70 factor (ECF subfamily)
MLADEQLAYRASIDRQAFAELYRRHVERVYAYHYTRTGNVDDAQDLTTLTFLAALEGIGRYRGSGSFAAWLFGIARNKLYTLFRSRRHEERLEALEDLVDPADHPETVTARRFELAEISRAMYKLPPDRAEALTLCVFSELSAEDAGRVMGKSPAAVKMLIYRGLKELREKHLIQPVEEK